MSQNRLTRHKYGVWFSCKSWVVSTLCVCMWSAVSKDGEGGYFSILTSPNKDAGCGRWSAFRDNGISPHKKTNYLDTTASYTHIHTHLLSSTTWSHLLKICEKRWLLSQNSPKSVFFHQVTQSQFCKLQQWQASHHSVSQWLLVLNCLADMAD